MQEDTLKQHFLAALREQWSDFAASHPHLAAVVDDDFWAGVIADSIDGDPAFHQAMNDAYAMGAALERGPAIVREFVGRWLKKIG
jgi:hypothetical protein